MRSKPLSNEYPAYYESYVSLIPDGDIEAILSSQRTNTLALFKSVSEELAAKAYSQGKWTLKEVVGHMADTERVMAYRMLCIARGESSALPGFDQDSYVSVANFNQMTWEVIQSDFDHVRTATLHLIKTIDEVSWDRKGSVWNNSVSTRAIAYIIAGHELHHLTVIRDKYL